MGNRTASASADDAGKLVLRLTLGVLLLFHGYAKRSGNFGFVEGVVGKAGLPHFVAYFVFLGAAVAMLGAGRYSVGGSSGHWN